MKRVTRFMISMMTLILPVLPAQATRAPEVTVDSAAASKCAEIVQQAWNNVDNLCDGTTRNQACYGHILLDAQPQPAVTQFSFNQEGEKVDVADLLSLRLSAMDLVSGTWGVALMQIKANLPASKANQSVSLLLFGDVDIENAGVERPTVDVTPSSPYNVLNVRYRPSAQAAIVGQIAPGEALTANGQLANGSWVRVELPERSIFGWVYAPLVKSVDNASLDILHTVDPGAVNYGPMQAFYFQSGGQDSQCAEAPNSGILIQTPEGVAEVTLLINEVDIQLGSTVYFQSESGNELTVSVAEGKARVTAFGETQTAFAGTQVGVPLDGNGLASGVPTPPRPYDLDNLAGLPVNYLPIPVVIAEPMTEEEIALAISQEYETSVSANGDGEETSDSDNNGQPNPSDGAAPPGLEGILPPGQTDDPSSNNPGHGGVPPGQAKKQ